MAKTKEEIRVDLIVKARELLVDKGLDFLTARKLSDYSGYSVGTIYNQFKSMDNLIVWENCQTLDELYGALTTADMGSDAYKNLNSSWKNLWIMFWAIKICGLRFIMPIFRIR